MEQRFQNLVRIGRGTYGEVYRADDTAYRPVHPVALKRFNEAGRGVPTYVYVCVCVCEWC